MVIQPSITRFSVYDLAAIATVLGVAGRDLATCFITKSALSLSIAFITAIVVTLLGLGLGLTEKGKMPSVATVLRMAAASVFPLVGYESLIEAMRTTEISAVALFRSTAV